MPQPNTDPALGIGNADILYGVQNTVAIGTSDNLDKTYFPIQGGAGFNGVGYDRQRFANVFKYTSNASLAPNTGMTAWTPASGKKFRVMGVTLQSSVANVYLLKDGAGGTIFQMIYPAANESQTIYLSNGYLSTTANNVMELYNGSLTTATVRISFFGTEE